MVVGGAEGPSEARPTCAALAVDVADEKRRKRRGERQRPREKKIVLPPPPATAAGRAMQLLGTMAQRGVGGAPVHTMEKALTRSDVDIEQCRLQLTPALVGRLLSSGMLTDAERDRLKGGIEGIDVEAVDRGNNKYNMTFKFCTSVGQYRIMKWAQFCVDHGLRVGQTMAIWVHRLPPEETEESRKLGLVLLYYDEGDARQKEMDAQLLDARVIDALNALLMLQGENAAAAAPAPAGGGS